MTEPETNKTETLSQQRFGQHAQAYVTSKPHAQGSDLDRLLKIAQPEVSWVVLDIATGGGHTALKFSPHVAHVTVTDITAVMLEAAGLVIAAATLFSVWTFAGPLAFAAMMSFGVLLVRTMANWVIVLFLLDKDIGTGPHHGED